MESDAERMARAQREWQAAHGGKPKRWQIVLGVVGIGVLALLMINPPERSVPATPPGEPAQIERLPVTARELFRAYDGNEVAAQARFGGKSLAVTGTVQSIDLDMTNDPVVRLETDNQFMAAAAPLEDKAAAAALTKGQSVTLWCEDVSEVLGSPQLRDCVLAR